MRFKPFIAKLAPLFVCVGMVGCTTVGPDYKIPENADTTNRAHRTFRCCTRKKCSNLMPCRITGGNCTTIPF